MIYNAIKHILPEFQFEGDYVQADEIHSGNINTTYHLTYCANSHPKHYTLQRINGYVFKRPDEVTKNIEQVTSHYKQSLIAEGLPFEQRVLELIPCKRGELIFCDREGDFWRAYKFIEDATAYDAVVKPEHFYEAGRAFGEFQRRLANFPAENLVETIPHFHNTTKRFYAFVQSIDENRAGRVDALEDEIEFFFERRRMMGEIVNLLKSGKLQPRVTHNDTKINNVMIDNETDKAICVIDLDTVMPGSSLYDFGDAIRYGASTAAEDEPNLSRVSLDLEKFKLFTKGFVKETNGFLPKEELRLLPLGVKVLTCELAMRFLKDYIDGDLYFKVRSPQHNLIRARAQMKLLTDIESKYDEMLTFVNELVN